MAEVELKFDLPPEAHAAFGELPALAAAHPSRKKLFALYFDTPRHDLRRNEMAMRLRRGGNAWKQALKAGRSGAGGLHAREEWEQDRPDASIDLSLLAHTPLAQLPGAANLHRSLAEVFRVEVERTTWELEIAPGTRVEVALDRGEVRHGEASEPISEVEIEILSGEAPAAFDFAETLLAAAPLRPSSVTKAQRGYRLARGGKPAPVKARAPRLTHDMTPGEAARAAIGAALAQLEANEAGALASPHPEYLHQARVAMRRLRAALRVFRKVLGADFARRADAGLSQIAQPGGEARDWDVIATRTLPAMLEGRGDSKAVAELRSKVAARRREARERMREELRSPRHARLMLSLARRLAIPDAGDDPEKNGSLRRFAERAADKRHRKLLERAAKPCDLDAAQRHKLRVEAKRTRYAVEALAPLLPAKRVKGYLKALSALQDELGEANDAIAAGQRLGEIGMAPELQRHAREWLRERERKALAKLEDRVARLREARPLREKR